FEKTADIARGLADALLVFHQRDANEVFAVLAEANAWRDRDVGLFHQQLGKFHTAERFERLGYRGPGKHRCPRRWHVPSSTGEAFDQHISPTPVCRTHLLDAIFGAVKRRRRRYLHGRKRAVVQIRFHPTERRDDALVSDREADAPARHRERL